MPKLAEFAPRFLSGYAEAIAKAVGVRGEEDDHRHPSGPHLGWKRLDEIGNELVEAAGTENPSR